MDQELTVLASARTLVLRSSSILVSIIVLYIFIPFERSAYNLFQNKIIKWIVYDSSGVSVYL